jgi:pyridoxal phosphate enzyme (YggS family)
MSIFDNLQQIKLAIDEAERASCRPLGSVQLLAVSKGQTTSAIIEAYKLGLNAFGESYAQEAWSKIQTLTEYPLIWHFIGPLQSNKTKIIAEHFQWVHSVSRDKIAELLNRYRPEHLAPLQLCIQVNLTGENTKSGIDPKELIILAQKILQYPRLQLRGLMLIPPPLESSDEQYQLFLELAKLMFNLNTSLGLNLDSLSMGMSNDFIPAIKAGSTIIRLGRSIFN